MESAANLHQLQDLVSSSSSSSSSSLPIIPSCFGLPSSHGWTPNLSLNNHNTNSDLTSSPPLNNSMLQDLAFHQWSALNSSSLNFFSQAGKIKEEISYPKFTEMLNNPTQDFDHFPSTNYIKNNNDNDDNNNIDSDLNDLSHGLLIKTLVSSQINGGDRIKPGEFYNISRSNNRGHFAQIYPSINVSDWNLSSPAPAFSNSLDLNLQTPADFLASGGNFSHSRDNFGVFRDRIEPLPAMLPCIPSKMTSFNSEVTESKRLCDSMEPRGNQQSSPLKKSRVDSRASCPPFKVRKEKLGDRIAALQQLVAPFGKTDTASVLMEAIGYIKFLQNQVETLSVPYMKPSSNKTAKPTHRSSVEDGNEGQPNRDLRSRGLCLVPVGCLSYVAGDGGSGGGIWPPPGFNGGTS